MRIDFNQGKWKVLVSGFIMVCGPSLVGSSQACNKSPNFHVVEIAELQAYGGTQEVGGPKVGGMDTP